MFKLFEDNPILRNRKSVLRGKLKVTKPTWRHYSVPLFKESY